MTDSEELLCEKCMYVQVCFECGIRWETRSLKSECPQKGGPARLPLWTFCLAHGLRALVWKPRPSQEALF